MHTSAFLEQNYRSLRLPLVPVVNYAVNWLNKVKLPLYMQPAASNIFCSELPSQTLWVLAHYQARNLALGQIFAKGLEKMGMKRGQNI